MLRSLGCTLAIGLMTPPSTWYMPRYSRVRSMLITSFGSSTTQITLWSRRGSAHTGHGLVSHTLPQICAEPFFFLDFRDGVDQCLQFLVGRVEQVEGDALRAFRPDAGQVGERVDESLDGAVIGQSHGSYLSLTGCRSHVPDN